MFVGLVTHAGSRYQELPKRAKELSLQFQPGQTVFVEDRNLGRTTTVRSFHRLLRPISVAIASVLWSMHRRLPARRGVKELLKELRLMLREIAEGIDHQMMTRNENIARAHLSVWREAISSNHEITVVLEDDALGDVDWLLRDGEEFLKRIFDLAGPDCWLMSLSASFTPRSLGVERLLSDRIVIESGETLLVAEKGYSDTLCATAFRTHRLRELHDWMEGRVGWLLRVLPIDWLLNLFIFSKALGGGAVTTGQLTPGVFSQGSLTGPTFLGEK